MKILKGILAATLLSVPTITFAQANGNPSVSSITYSNALPLWLDAENDNIIIEFGNSAANPIKKENGVYWQITVSPLVEPTGIYSLAGAAASDYVTVEIGTYNPTIGTMVYIRTKPTIDFPASTNYTLTFQVIPREVGSSHNITAQVNYEIPFAQNTADDNIFSPISVIDPMNVQWLYVNGKAVDQTSVITWGTTSETDCQGFELQKSIDGRTWTTIAYVASKAEGGNSISALEYESIDYNPVVGRNIYRVKQIDLDGTFGYSRDVVVNHANIKNSIVLYPNPASQSVNLRGLSGENTIELIDVLGRKLINETRDGDNQSIDISSVAAGNYILNVIDANGQLTSFKLVKE